MPIAQIHILEGRNDEQKETLIREVSEAISRSLDAPLTSVRVIITEMAKGHFGIGGELAQREWEMPKGTSGRGTRPALGRGHKERGQVTACYFKHA